MLSGAFIFLIETAFGLFTIALLLRFYLQCVRASYRNPLAEFLNAITDFAVRPARRVIPGLWGLDLATLVLAWLAQFVEILLVIQVKGLQPGSAIANALLGLTLLALLLLAKLGLYIIMVAVVIQAVLSWINPYSPVAPLLNAMTRPFLRVFQRLIPPVGNVDLSPLFVIIACQLLLMVPVAYLEMSLSRLL
ncbi:MAG: YggT family protein [Burkholderiales bacterium]